MYCLNNFDVQLRFSESIIIMRVLWNRLFPDLFRPEVFVLEKTAEKNDDEFGSGEGGVRLDWACRLLLDCLEGWSFCASMKGF